jgi:transcriptional regulator with XRE-family HTH domain
MTPFSKLMFTERRKRKMTLAQMAEFLDVSLQSVSHWERGENEPLKPVMEAVALRLKLTTKPTKDDPFTFADFLKSERTKRGLSKSQMGKIIGMRNYYTLENGAICWPLMREGIRARLAKLPLAA